MPVTFISQFKGLITSNNILNESDGSLVLAHNISYSRDDLIEPRHGYQQTNISGTQDIGFQTYAYRGTVMYKAVLEGRTLASGGGTEPIQIIYLPREDNQIDIGGLNATNYSILGIRGNFPAASGEEFVNPRIVSTLKNSVINSNKRLYRTVQGNLAFVSKAPKVWRLEATGYVSTNSAIVAPQKAVDIIAIAYHEYSSEDQKVYGYMSNRVTVRNALNTPLAVSGSFRSTVLEDNTNTLARTFVEIYRSEAYDPYTEVNGVLQSNPAPPLTAFRLAAPPIQVLSTFGGPSELTSNYVLNLNDAALNVSSTTLPLEDGIVAVGADYLGAADMHQFQGYTFYADTQTQQQRTATITSLNGLAGQTITLSYDVSNITLTSNPTSYSTALPTSGSNGTLSNRIVPGTVRLGTGLGVSGSVVDDGNGLLVAADPDTLQRVVGSINYENGNYSVTGVPARTEASYVRYDLSANSAAFYIDSNDWGNSATMAVSGKYRDTDAYLRFDGVHEASALKITDSVYFSSTAGASPTGSGLLISTTAPYNDYTRFAPLNGIVAVTNSTNTVTGIFAYRALTQTTTPGTFLFEDVSSVGSVTGTNSDYYYLTATDISNISVYIGNGIDSYSLIPVDNKLQSPVGVPASGMASFIPTSGGLLLDVGMFGVARKLTDALIGNTLQNLISRYYNVIGQVPNILQYQTNPLPAIFFENATNVTGSAAWQAVLSPNLTSYSFDERERAGFYTSRLNLPDYIQKTSSISPFVVGDPNKDLLRLASTTNSLFAFKKDEGIYRIEITQGGNFPVIDSINLLDNTTYLVAKESVQEIDESLYFLSQKGVYKLTSTSLAPISENVNQLIRKLISASGSFATSIGNEFRKEYKLSFPYGLGDGQGPVTLVYNTLSGQWYTSDEHFQYGITQTDRRQLFSKIDYDLSVAPTGMTTDSINAATVNYSSPRWNYMKREAFTDSQPDNAADQYEDIQTFSTIVGNNVSTSQISFTRTFFGTTPPATGTTRMGPSGTFVDMFTDMKNKQLYVYLSDQNYTPTVITARTLPVTLVSYSNPTSSTEQVRVQYDPANIDNQDPTTDLANGTPVLVVGVNSEIQFRPFHAGQPQTNKRFSDFAVTVQDNAPKYIYTKFKVDNQVSFSGQSYLDLDVVPEQTLYRTFIPLEQSRGRLLYPAVGHNTPFEKFTINGISIRYQNSGSLKVDKAR